MTHRTPRLSRIKYAARAGLASALMLGATIPACLDRPIATIDPITSFVIKDALPQERVNKIDILLAIDDSGSMGDKQQILASAVPDLVKQLVNPPCVGQDPADTVTPDSPLDECPDGTNRRFTPVLDIHIGVISTGLGPRGGNESCTDNGRFVARAGAPATFEDKGFLVWDPEGGAAPGNYQDAAALNADVTKMVTGVGEDGCGFEAQLESWYRFLVDPSPYNEVVLSEQETGFAVASLRGVDDDLLTQRKDFLRPDSLVAIIVLSDENDCSFKPDPFGYLTGTNGIMTLKARAACAEDPSDPCCAVCTQKVPDSCAPDPSCAEAQPIEQLQSNLRCFEQKRRYGIDLLHNTQRYIDGLTKTTIKDRDGNEVDNPLLVSADGVPRGNDRVFFAGVVGVPWQLIARDKDDLSKGFQNAEELTESGSWDKIVGDPSAHIPPSDPHMVESIQPRAGLEDSGGSYGADPIHGHEFDIDLTKKIGDLQYACTFELPQPIDCADDNNCDCKESSIRSNDPLCQAPDGSYGTTQYRAKAYPGLRQLEVLKGIGDQGIVGSICAADLSDDSVGNPAYGYRPAIQAVIERLTSALVAPCLGRNLTPDPETNQVQCLVLEGRRLPESETCSCDHAAARRSISPQSSSAAQEALARPESQARGINCVCEIAQTQGEALKACQQDPGIAPKTESGPVDGWCYVDEDINKALVSECIADKQIIRFVGEGDPVNDSLVYLTCLETTDN